MFIIPRSALVIQPFPNAQKYFEFKKKHIAVFKIYKYICKNMDKLLAILHIKYEYYEISTQCQNLFPCTKFHSEFTLTKLRSKTRLISSGC